MSLAWQIARETWYRDGAKDSFATLLANYLREGGYTVAFPEFFVLAMPSCWHDGDLRTEPDPAKADTWFVHLAAMTPDFIAKGLNPVAAFLRLAPFRLPFVAWHRRGQGNLRRYSTARLLARVRTKS